MLTIQLISKNHDFYAANLSSPALVVTPNPQIADQTRKNFENAQQQVECITISRFIQDELSSLIADEELQNFRGKSELTLLLGAIWQRIGNEDNYIGFKKAFNLLTELRSFSMSDQVFEEVLGHYDPQIAESVLMMHKILEQMSILDEHKSYFLLSERLRAGDLPPEKKTERTIIFYGFDYMTASQVDLLKSLALRDDVIIPCYKKAYDLSNSSDWIRWFDEYNLNVEDLSSTSELRNKLRFLVFGKGYFSKTLKDKVDYEFCVLGTKTLSPELIQEISFENSAFKVSVDLFSSEISWLKENLEDLISGGEKDIDLVRDFLREKSISLVAQQKIRKLKSCMLVIGKLSEWQELSSENKTLGSFELEILFESVLLDAPRVNLTSLAHSHDHFIKSLSDIDEVKNKRAVLGVHGLHQAIKGINANYSEGVEKHLASIGPIRGADFEVNVFRERLREFIEDNDVLLLIENGILEHDTHWSKIFSDFELVEEEKSEPNSIQKMTLDFPKASYQLESISASKLQRYYDCPQKFYFQYGEKLLPRIEFDDELLPMELGNLQHKIIEKYFEQFKSFTDHQHDEVISELLGVSLTQVDVSSELEQEYFVELKSYTKDIILNLFELKVRYGLELKFEFPFSSLKNKIKFSGSIDCYLYNSEMFIILDFKRSNSVFQTFSGILDFDQLQLWFYLTRLVEMEKFSHDDNISFGYINLSELKTSMIFTSEKDNIDLFKTEMKIGKVKHVPNLNETLSMYAELEVDLIKKIENDNKFLPAPRKPQVCNFCELKNICSRGICGNT